MMMNNESEKDDKEWLKLCELVAHEQDPQRLSDLVGQLIKKLDARRRELRTTDQPASESNKKNN
jgi:hypothetical protein